LEQTNIEKEDAMVVEQGTEVSVPEEIVSRSPEEAEDVRSHESEVEAGSEELPGAAPEPMSEVVTEELTEISLQDIAKTPVEELVATPSEEAVEDSSGFFPETVPEIAVEERPETEVEEIPATEHEELLAKEPEEGAENEFININTFEREIASLRSAIENIQQHVDGGFASNTECISEMKVDVANRADSTDFKKLKRDFRVFSKRLRRVAKEADATSAEVLDAAKIPPDVLEIIYAKTLNDVYSEILNEFGEREAFEIVADVMDNVRQSSAGVDFFRFEDGSFLLLKLAEAIEAKLVSPKQIHATYVEFFKELSGYVPNYESRDFRSFVETGSREYTVERIAVHEKRLEKFNQELGSVKDELARICEHFESIEKIEDQRAEEIKANVDDLLNITGKFKTLADAVNSHTRFIKKLSENIRGTQSIAESYQAETAGRFNDLSSYMESTFETKADQVELQTVTENLSSFREDALASSEMLKSQIESGLDAKADTDRMENTISDLSAFREEFRQLQQEVVFLRSASKLPALDRIVYSTLYGLEKATMKKLERQIISDGTEIHGDELFATVDRLEKKGYISLQKKGRYTYYSLNI